MLVGAYALGKAQRVIAELRRAGYNEPIWLHGALERMCRLYEELGVDLGELRLVADARKADLDGPDRALPARGAQRPLERAPPDPITGDGVGLDAGAPARACSAMWSCRWSFPTMPTGTNSTPDDRGGEPGRDVDHTWPGGCAAALVRAASKARARAGAGGL